jgi:hypothetical protein
MGLALVGKVLDRRASRRVELLVLTVTAGNRRPPRFMRNAPALRLSA